MAGAVQAITAEIGRAVRTGTARCAYIYLAEAGRLQVWDGVPALEQVHPAAAEVQRANFVVTPEPRIGQQ